MKFLNLVYEGTDKKTQSIDFSSKIYGVSVLSGIDKDYLKNILSLALFGTSESRADTLPTKTTLEFFYGDNQYSLVRTFSVAESVEETAILTNITKDKLVLSDWSAVNDYITQTIGMDKSVFNRLFVINKEALLQAFGSDDITRSCYVSTFLSEIPAASQVEQRLSALQEKEAELLNRIGSIDRVTKKAINDSQLKTDFQRMAVDELQEQIMAVRVELATAKEYDQNYAEYYDAAEYMERLNNMRDNVEQMAQALAVSMEAEAIAEIFTDYKKSQQEIANQQEELNSKEKEFATLQAKYNDGENTVKKLEQSFILTNEKNHLLNAKLKELISQTAKAPKDYKIDKAVASYYADMDTQADKLSARLVDVNKDFADLSNSIDELEAKKAQLVRTAGYKESITQAAFYETALSHLSNSISHTDSMLIEYEKEQGALTIENNKLSAQIKSLTAKKEELKNTIKGRHATIKDAVNADTLYKQTIYSKHLTVSANEIEIGAVDAKIKEVSDANKRYKNKLNENKNNKEEITLHLEKLNIRYDYLTDRRTNHESFNRMRSMADDLEYGSNCPVCDGFVMVKKTLPQKDTEALDAQIIAVKGEIQKSQKALTEVVASIGQYDMASKVSEQYLSSLQDTKQAKLDIINKILDAYKAKDVPALFAMVQSAVEASNKLTLMLDEYNEINTELQKAIESSSQINLRLSKLTLQLLPETRERLNQLVQESRDYLKKYEALQGVLKGRNASELLAEHQVVEKEYEAVEKGLAEKREALAVVRNERDELYSLVTILDKRGLDVDVSGDNLSYQHVVVKAVMSDLSVLVQEIVENDGKLEIMKTRLAGLNRVVARLRAELETLSKTIAVAKEKLASYQSLTAELYAKFQSRFDELGLKELSDLDMLILNKEVATEYHDKINEYDAEITSVNNTISRLNDKIAQSKPFYDNINDIQERLSVLRTSEQKAMYQLGENIKATKTMQDNYDSLLSLNLQLSYLQGKIKGIDDISMAIKDGEIIGKDLATLIITQANSKVKNWSKDRYIIESDDSGVYLVSGNKGKRVPPSKYNKEEKALLQMGLVMAFNELLTNALGGSYSTAMVIDAELSDKVSVSVLAEASKERDIVILPLDEKTFLNSLSKLD